MTEGLSELLSNDHNRALRDERLLREAKALEAWLMLAAMRGMSRDEAGFMAQAITGSSDKKIKKFHKEILTATKLEKKLKKALASAAGVDKLTIQAEPAPTNDPLVTDGDQISGSRNQLEKNDGADQEISEQLQAAVVEQVPDTVLEMQSLEKDADLDTTMSSDVTIKNNGWALEILGEDFDFEDKSPDEIAQAIYQKAGSPKIYKRKGGADSFDPIERIRLKLTGLNAREIGEIQGYEPTAVNSWFGALKKKTLLPSRESTDADPETTTDASSHDVDADLSEVKEDSPQESELEQTEVLDMSSVETVASADVDTKKIAIGLAKLINFTPEEEEMLIELLSPEYYFELSGTHKAIRHKFRMKLSNLLPRLEDSDLDLTKNEIARLNALLGRRKNQNNKWQYDGPSQSVYQVSQHDGKLDKDRQNQVLLALQKVHDFLLPISENEVTPHQAEELRDIFLSTLQKGGFDLESAQALKDCYEFNDGRPLPRSANTSAALEQLQMLLLKQSKKIGDHPALPGLRMLSNKMFGQKTVLDVYHSMHKKKGSITQDEVTEILKSGTVVLIEGK